MSEIKDIAQKSKQDMKCGIFEEFGFRNSFFAHRQFVSRSSVLYAKNRVDCLYKSLHGNQVGVPLEPSLI